MISLDSRLSLITGGNRNSLLLKNVTEQDDGEYSCQITAQTGVLTLTHSLTVLVPPTAEVKPGSGEIRVEEGARVKLECVVTGIPFPLVRWFKKNKPVSGVHNSCPNQTCITLPAVDRSSAGQYVCQASNGIGETASASIDVLVQYGPVVKVHEPSVQGGSGKQIQLAC
ncbi:neuronal growth regulator 1, partial [Eurytemora carolleeae]|uniref:neuronal growth regulator 1 n=1 Tax=Eurytemora carolleeae TaxID=1294199 RepID=UPI000C763F4B